MIDDDDVSCDDEMVFVVGINVISLWILFIVVDRVFSMFFSIYHT